jgi:glutaredoxin
MTNVLLLTAPACHYCDEARSLLARLASEFELQVETQSATEASGLALALTHGVLFPPAIFINGAFVQYGRPSERKLRARLLEVGAHPRVAANQ